MNSRFWRYFHDKLNWLPIHSPGPLSAIIKGLAHHLDESREDILYLRNQWHPAKCELEAVLGFGQSRNIIRHEKESPEQFRKRVVNAWNWHLLGGKTEGLPQILKFYGFDCLRIETLRDFQPSRWAEFQLGLKIPASQTEQQLLLDSLDTLIWLVNEYKPARSILSRVYTDTYNLNPAVWSGEKVQHGWSQGFWSKFSGVDYAGEDIIIVSFGMAHRIQCEKYNTTGAGLGITEFTGFIAPYIDRPVWSRSYWSEVFPRNHGFTIGEIVSFHFCERITSSWPWFGLWNNRKWRQTATWDRVLPKWKMRRLSWPKSQAVWSWPGDSKESGEQVMLYCDGTYGDINACYSKPTAQIYQGSVWGDTWGKNPKRQNLVILERRQHRNVSQTPAISPQALQAAGAGNYAFMGNSLTRRGWRGSWAKHGWQNKTFAMAKKTFSRHPLSRLPLGEIK